jgi:hypothetical protein
MSDKPWKAPRYEVQTNRHPDLNGQAWGWIEDRRTGLHLHYWQGYSEKANAEVEAERLNRDCTE